MLDSIVPDRLPRSATRFRAKGRSSRFRRQKSGPAVPLASVTAKYGWSNTAMYPYSHGWSVHLTSTIPAVFASRSVATICPELKNGVTTSVSCVPNFVNTSLCKTLSSLMTLTVVPMVIA